jgi:hypothetical protein
MLEMLLGLRRKKETAGWTRPSWGRVERKVGRLVGFGLNGQSLIQKLFYFGWRLKFKSNWILSDFHTDFNSNPHNKYKNNTGHYECDNDGLSLIHFLKNNDL